MAADAREAASSNQTLLFDVPKETQVEDQFPDKPEWSVDEKIRYEKETLGFYITGHPLARFEDEIRMFGDVTCETLRERLDAPVKLVGLVGAVKKSQIKKGQNEGKMMAKAVVEDLTGSVPVTVFASLLERVGSWLAPGRPVLVTGTVRLSMAPGGATHDAVRKRVRRHSDRDHRARDPASRGHAGAERAGGRDLSPNFDTFDEAAMGEILRRYPGSMPVFLEMRRSGQFEARQKIDPRLWVRPTPDFTASMETLLGPKSVRYSYPASP